MGFNAKAFAAGFLSDSAMRINERVKEAREYKRELKENAEEGKTKITQLRQLGNLAKSEISRLRSLGFEDKHINAAIASGPKGLFDLSVSAQEEAARRNFTSGQKFDEYEIESLIDFSENFSYGDVKSEEFYKMNTALTDPSLGSTQDPQRGLMKTIFGIDLDDAVRSKLDKDAYYDGYSVMDINEISKQETYDSVAPGTYFSFTPTRDFDPTSAASSFNRMVSLIDSTIDSNIRDDVYIKRAMAEGLETDAANARAMELAKLDKRQKLLNQVGLVAKDDPEYINRFRTLLTDNGLTEEDIAGLEYSNLEDDDLERKVVRDILKAKPSINKDVENKFSVVHNGVRHEIIIGADKKVKGLIIGGQTAPEEQVDDLLKDMATKGLIPSVQLAGEEPVISTPEVPETTSLDLEIKVPPRPNAFTSRFTGVSLDYETRQQILNGEIDVPDNLRVDEWDELFGDTHNPETGKKLGEEPEIIEQEDTEAATRNNPYTFSESMSNADKNKAYDNLPSGAFYIHPVTNKLSQKK